MDVSLAERLSAWGRDVAVVRRLGGGHRSEVWLADVGGERCAVRRSRRAAEALEWELDLIEYLAQNGVVVPKIVRTRSGARAYGDVVVLSWIAGSAPSSERDWIEVARELHRIHGFTKGWPQRPTFASTQDLIMGTSGGDVDLNTLPSDAVARCRDAWRELSAEPMSAMHGDPRGNVLMTARGVGFIDWDEARVDASILDLADVPFTSRTVAPGRLARARQAASAWEAANSWVIEPEYARRRLAQLG